MAFSMVGRAFVSCYAMWEDEAGDEANLRWLPSAMAELEPLRSATSGRDRPDRADSRAERSFAQPNWDRLQQVRRDGDPKAVFASYLAPE